MVQKIRKHGGHWSGGDVASHNLSSASKPNFQGTVLLDNPHRFSLSFLYHQIFFFFFLIDIFNSTRKREF